MRFLTIALLSLSVSAALFASAARPATVGASVLCEKGSGAGQCLGPRGVAVDGDTGRVYVVDRDNGRIDAFDAESGGFLSAFGWGVEDGVGLEPQTCIALCFPGISGGGAGQLKAQARSLAIDNSSAGTPPRHDLYVADGARIQRLGPNGEFILTWGGGVVAGGAAGSGDLTAGSTEVGSVTTTQKAFLVGQAITGAGIPPGAIISELGPGTITLSKQATASANGVALTVAEGPGNEPVNEVQEVTLIQPSTSIELRFRTLDPSPSTATTAKIPKNATVAMVQQALNALPNLGPGNVQVTLAPGGDPGGGTGLAGPWEIEFKGRFADTDVLPLEAPNSGAVGVAVQREGASGAEICTAANAPSCEGGQFYGGEGRFDSALAVATGPGGVVYAVDGIGNNFPWKLRLQKFAANGVALGPQLDLGMGANPGALAVDSSGDFYIALGGIRKFHPDGSEYGAPFPQGSNQITALAVDSSDHLYAAEKQSGFEVITEYSPTGGILRRFGYGEIERVPTGLAAFHSAAGDVFVSEENANRVRQIAFPPAGPLVPQVGLDVSPLGNTKATLRARINPEGDATSYRFEYVDDATYQADIAAEGAGHGFDHAKITPAPDGSVGSDFALHDVSAPIGCADPVNEPPANCLAPATKYHYRVVAANSANPSGTSAEAEFTTEPPFSIVSTWATGVGTDAATLHAEVNPFGIAASGFFEYVSDAEFNASGFAAADRAPIAPLDFGSGDVAKGLATTVTGLDAGTTYHYRIVVKDPFAEVNGETHLLATFGARPAPPSPDPCANAVHRTGASAFLAECRAYEMVSPVEKNGTDIVPLINLNQAFAELDQSASGGGRFTYSTSQGFGDSKGTPYVSQYLASRGSEGWANHGITPPQGLSPLEIASRIDVEFRGFSEDLCQSVLLNVTNLPLAEGAVEGFANLYRRGNCGVEDYEALSTVTPPNRKPTDYLPEVQGFTQDGSCVVFRAPDQLTPEAQPSPPTSLATRQLYESCGGQLHLISVLPSGLANSNDASVGTTNNAAIGIRTAQVAGAVSADGSRVFWTGTGSLGAGTLYLREHAQEPQSAIVGGECVEAGMACTVPVSALVPGGNVARFWSGAADATKAFFTIGGNIFSGGRLYEFDSTNAAEPTRLIADQVLGVMGAAADGSSLYFVSTEAIAGSGQNGEGREALAKQPNLYMRSGAGAATFIGTLAAADIQETNSYFSPISIIPEVRSSRVSPDGRHIVFMSSASLTGFDNKDAVSGEADAEVYAFDAISGDLSCVSCSPSGSRPVGVVAPVGAEKSFTVAAARIPGYASQLYGSRVISNDGSHVFFNSYEPLVAGDVNGVEDVYQWQAPGSGGCAASSPSFNPNADGCVALVSSGESPQGSEFIDASADGTDVFFRTSASLVDQDDGLVDIYDARIGGGYPPPPGQPAACEGEACQGPYTPPSDATPASAVFQGAGNVVEKPAHKKKKHKKKHRKKHAKKQKQQQGQSGRGQR